MGGFVAVSIFCRPRGPGDGAAGFEGRKKEFEAFGWAPESIPDPEKPETFERSKLKWNEVNEGEHAEMLAWYRELITLRKGTPELNECEPDRTRVQYDEEARWLVVERGGIRVLCNLGESAHAFDFSSRVRVLLESQKSDQESGRLTLAPDVVAIVKID